MIGQIIIHQIVTASLATFNERMYCPTPLISGLTGYVANGMWAEVLCQFWAYAFRNITCFRSITCFYFWPLPLRKTCVRLPEWNMWKDLHPTSRLKDTTSSWVQIGWTTLGLPLCECENMLIVVWCWDFVVVVSYGSKGPTHSGWVTVTSIMPCCIICAAPASVLFTFIFSYMYSLL